MVHPVYALSPPLQKALNINLKQAHTTYNQSILAQAVSICLKQAGDLSHSTELSGKKSPRWH